MRSQNPQALTFHETLIPVIAIIVPIAVLFMIRGLNKGEKNTITTHNVYNLQSDFGKLEEKEKEHYDEIKQILRNISQETRQTCDKVNQTFSTIGGDIKLHTSAIAQLQIELGKLQDRLRQAEGDIIRNSRT